MAGELKTFSALIDVDAQERLRCELRILEGLMANAIREKAWDAALKIFEKAHELLRRAAAMNAG
jgi:hypothetical protein